MDKQVKQAKRPARYKLYDKIKLKVSLHTMNIVIIAIVALIVLAILIGIIL